MRKEKRSIKLYWQSLKRKIQVSLIRWMRDCGSRYIEWRLDRGLPVTGRGLRFLQRRLSVMTSRCWENEQEESSCIRIFATQR
mgnify:CR=1 FL=1